MEIDKIVYSEDYYVDIGAHVFPTLKYRLIYDQLVNMDGISKSNFVSPRPAEEKDVLLVHTKDYVRKLRTLSLSQSEILTLELPLSPDLVRVSYICAGGTILAAKNAISGMTGVHLGGGFHHAFPDHGEGFCILNDIAIGIRRLQADRQIRRALIVDCDLHHGNGTAAIFSHDRDVFTFSIHQENNYPFFKPPSDLDIGLADGTTDEEYLGRLKDNLPRMIDNFKPELILYVAGADPYKDDQLGDLSLTMDGLRRRDEFVFKVTRSSQIPIVVILAGGYAFRIEDTVKIHLNTIKTALNAK